MNVVKKVIKKLVIQVFLFYSKMTHIYKHVRKSVGNGQLAQKKNTRANGLTNIKLVVFISFILRP